MDTGRQAGRGGVWEAGRYWLPPLVWMGVIFYLSSRSHLPNLPQPLLRILLMKGGHFVGYGALALLWRRALSRTECTADTVVTVAFVISALYAVVDEFHQGFVLGRHPSPLDVLIDSAGAATALWLIGRRRHAKKRG